MKTRLLALASAIACGGFAHAAGLQFLVVDPVTRLPVDAIVRVQGITGSVDLQTYRGRTPVVDSVTGEVKSFLASDSDATIVVPVGTSLQVDQRPETVFKIVVTARRRTVQPANAGASSQTRTREDIQKFVGNGGGDIKQLTKGEKGVAEDSAGQQHIRGEHTDISYVVDGVPLPDTLSGRQGAIVVPSNIDTLEIVTGGFAPEFGGQTAAVLNIGTVPGARKAETDIDGGGGSFGAFGGEITAVGPLTSRGSYVVNIGSDRTQLGLEPQQPGPQSTHDAESSENVFGKFRFAPTRKDSLTLTLSNAPDALQINNRAGLPDSFAEWGQGYGFGGFRDANGTRPTSTIAPGADADSFGGEITDPTQLHNVEESQQQAGMDINQWEVSEFATLNWQHRDSDSANSQLAVTMLHSAQEVTNNNPSVDVMNLPVDAAIEYNPTATRNIHQAQIIGSHSIRSRAHRFKFGFLFDADSGKESYQVVPASRLALDALASLDAGLAPEGTSSSQLDVDGYPVFTPTSGITPTLDVQRHGWYQALYGQDTWLTGRLTINYGLRWDSYFQGENLGQPDVKLSMFSPRANFSYKASRRDTFNWSYNRLFNTPPASQGAIVGQPVLPETLNQYDLAWEHKVARGQTASVAYYYKDIRNQTDVGLLVPGSEIGLYSAVSFQRGAVHGLETSYDFSNVRNWDAYVNYTHSAAMPNGNDNTGAEAPDFNDHDQRDTLGLGLAYTFHSGATAAATLNYGSGLTSSIVNPAAGRISRTQVDLHMDTGDQFFAGRGGLTLEVQNLFDERNVINFESGFSGTRFMMGRRLALSAHVKF
jgi:outer membrane cobalamin receptor